MDTNPVAGDDEHIDANIFWPALKRFYQEKHRTMHTDNKEIVSLKLNKSDNWCMKKNIHRQTKCDGDSELHLKIHASPKRWFIISCTKIISTVTTPK